MDDLVMPDKPKLLIVDDQVNNLFTLREIINDHNFAPSIEVVEACSGEDALRILMTDNFFLILMDVQMPEMGGIEAATLLRKRQNHHTPIIFVTANDSDKDTVVSAYEAGGADYIQKPIEENFLVCKINVFLKLWLQEQELLEKNVALKRSNSELEGFAYVVSHDLKQPINSIIGFGNKVLDETDRLSDRQMQGLHKIIDSAKRMSGLTSQLIVYAKLQSEAYVEEEVYLDKVVSDVLVDLDVMIADRDAKITVGQMCTARNNSHHMYQILLNLVNNALKFTRSGVVPEITIICEKWGGNGGCQLKVSDNGIGFPEGKVGEMFTPFKRLTSDEYEGFGIGLGTVQRIVSRHNGSIDVESTPGLGSTFIINLPVNSVSPPPH